tara:strand:+ start:1947 stop:3251 length:1305 start_codon:yes stop_codon:yes gene_type:complete
VAIVTTWQCGIGYYDNGTSWTFTDLTSRTTGLTIDQFTDLGVVGTSSAAVTFENNDGALTPQGGGTYSATDWFSRALVIRAIVTADAGTETIQVFGGIIDDFQLQDDGITSTVMMGAIDVVQTAGRQVIDANWPSPSVTYTNAWLATRVLLDPSATENNTKMPRWGETAETDGVLDVTGLSPIVGGLGTYAGRPVVLDPDIAEEGPVGDYMANAVATAGLTALWPGALNVTTGHAELFIIENAQKRDIRSFLFAEDVDAGELPFRNLERAFNVDQMTNAAQITRVGQTVTQTHTGSTVPIYGPRVRIYQSGASTDANALQDAKDWVKRFEYSRFVAERVQVTASMVEQHAADADYDTWAELLDPELGIWAGANVEYTPAGIGSAKTSRSLITGRTIKATPADTTVTLTLRPAIDYGTFTLDSATLGILSINRLG